MTFEGRARQGVQGIRRAVEVMEMSDTKTPQTLTRFDRYRQQKSKNQRMIALVVGVALPIVLILGAWRLFGSDETTGPATPASVTPSQSVTGATVSGHSVKFNAPFKYTVPADWRLTGEDDGYFAMRTPDATDTDVILLSSVVPAATDCSGQPAQGVGTSSDAMTRWLSTHPALVATTPHAVTLGAATGSYVDVKLSPNWNQNCAKELNLVTGHPDAPQTWGISAGEKERFYVLDLPSGDTVTIVIDDTYSGGGFESLINEAAPVVNSFRFLR